jgi:hypothetical protein
MSRMFTPDCSTGDPVNRREHVTSNLLIDLTGAGWEVKRHLREEKNS